VLAGLGLAAFFAHDFGPALEHSTQAIDAAGAAGVEAVGQRVI
jgi:hypothetical protein